MTITRRLAAILAADVAGYSRLMAADEVGTLEMLKACRREVFDPAIAEHTGRIVKTTGDGMLVEFASAVDAVTCAMAVQEVMTARGGSITFRIGINVGDIIIDGGDIFGDGVNVASRVENECKPGAVCLSSNAFEQIRNKTSFAFDDLGEKQLKNIDRPVRIYATRASMKEHVAPVAVVPEAASVQTPKLKLPSIVVLPLQNMSADPEQEYFADGLTENLTTDLSRIGTLFVVGRNTAFTYKGKAIDLKQVGRELGVRYALEGSVQSGGDKIRVNVQLIDTETGGHLWATRIDRDRSDLFKAQDEISRSVANSSERMVITAEFERVKREGIHSATADDFILRASAPDLWGSTQQRLGTRLWLFEQAMQLDPQNPVAWAGVALNRATRAFLGWSPDRADDMRAALAAAERALALVHGHPRVTYAKGHVAFAARDYATALEAYERASELNPSSHNFHQLAGMAKTALGRAEEALPLQDEAIRLSPRDMHLADIYVCKGWALWELERYTEALPILERSRAENVELTLTSAFLVSTHLRMGQRQKAEAEVKHARQYQANWTTKVVEASYPLCAKSLAALVDDLREAGLPE
jgi:adenylate cyclase